MCLAYLPEVAGSPIEQSTPKASMPGERTMVHLGMPANTTGG
jgi:hypothetical protein